MPAYYNENNPEKAEWLRVLISRNLIAPGDVDERSITDVQPDDVKHYTQCHWFAGIGLWSLACRQAGWPDDKPIWTASCPCQPFSTAGRQAGTNDARHLWPELWRIARAVQPERCVGEQVAKKNGLAWLDIVFNDLEESHYTCGAVVAPACGFGAPHIRERLYWAALRPNTSGMGDPDSERCDGEQVHLLAGEPRQANPEATGGSRNGGHPDARHGRLAQPPVPGLQGQSGASGNIGEEHPAAERDRLDEQARHELAHQGGLAHPLDLGHDGRWKENYATERPEPAGHNAINRGSPTNWWDCPDWVLTKPIRVGDPWCLRPTEPGTQPLDDGHPEGMGRVRNPSFPVAEKQEARRLRLIGYGDAIVVPQAAAFLGALLEEGA